MSDYISIQQAWEDIANEQDVKILEDNQLLQKAMRNLFAAGAIAAIRTATNAGIAEALRQASEFTGVADRGLAGKAAS